jgi:hypothetical protein
MSLTKNIAEAQKVKKFLNKNKNLTFLGLATTLTKIFANNVQCKVYYTTNYK